MLKQLKPYIAHLRIDHGGGGFVNHTIPFGVSNLFSLIHRKLRWCRNAQASDFVRKPFTPFYSHFTLLFAYKHPSLLRVHGVECHDYIRIRVYNLCKVKNNVHNPHRILKGKHQLYRVFE